MSQTTLGQLAYVGLSLCLSVCSSVCPSLSSSFPLFLPLFGCLAFAYLAPGCVSLNYVEGFQCQSTWATNLAEEAATAAAAAVSSGQGRSAAAVVAQGARPEP